MVITVKAIIQVMGFPAEYVQESLNRILTKLESEEGIKIKDQKSEEPKEVEKMWSGFADITIEVENIVKLSHFCTDYLPVSVEISGLDELKFKPNEFTDVFNDLIERLHKYNAIIAQLNAQNRVLTARLQKETTSNQPSE